VAKIQLVKTGGGCPESYNAYISGNYVGELYLRHGVFIVSYYDSTLLRGYPIGDGIFDYDERDGWLKRACEALLTAHNAPDEELYEILTEDEFNER